MALHWISTLSERNCSSEAVLPIIIASGALWVFRGALIGVHVALALVGVCCVECAAVLRKRWRANNGQSNTPHAQLWFSALQSHAHQCAPGIDDDQGQHEAVRCVFERLDHDCLCHIAGFLQCDMGCVQPVTTRRLWAVNAQETAVHLTWLEHTCRSTSLLADAAGVRACDNAARLLLDSLLQAHSNDPSRCCRRLPPGSMNWKHALYAYGCRVHFGWARGGREVPELPPYSSHFHPQTWLCPSVLRSERLAAITQMNVRWFDLFLAMGHRQLCKASGDSERERAQAGLAGMVETNALAHYNALVRSQSSVLWMLCNAGSAEIFTRATAEVQQQQEIIARSVALPGGTVTVR